MTDGPIPVADLEIADRIVRAAATGPPGDREPTVAQLLAAFDEPQATPDARRRVAAALEMAGAQVAPDLLSTPADGRVRITPPGRPVRTWSTAQRLGAGAAAIAGVIALVSVVAPGGGAVHTADRDLPAGTTVTRSATTPARTTATAARGRPKASPQAIRRGVTVRISPVKASFVCVDDGHGTILYRGTLSAPRHFSGHHIRVNIARRSVVLTVDGRRIHMAQSPTGYDINLHHVTVLPATRRPCPSA